MAIAKSSCKQGSFHLFKRLLRSTIILSFVLSFSTAARSQTKDSVYIVISSFQGNLFLNGACVTDSVDFLCKGTVFTVTEIVGDIVRVHVDFSTRDINLCPDDAYVGFVYCINKALFEGNSSIQQKRATPKKWDHRLGGGLLTIPFKFDGQSFKVFPAGEIGFVGGLRFIHIESKNSFIVGAIMGLSSIPLNDLNSTNVNEIKTVSGVTFGGGISVTAGYGFQFGFYYGVDLYNTNNIKYQKDWLSFGLGYDFFRLFDDKREKISLAPLH